MFCKYCGKELADGEICGCEEAQMEAEQKKKTDPSAAVQANVNNTNFDFSKILNGAKAMWRDFLDMTIAYVKNPQEAYATQYTKQNPLGAYFALGVYLIVSMLCIWGVYDMVRIKFRYAFFTMLILLLIKALFCVTIYAMGEKNQCRLRGVIGSTCLNCFPQIVFMILMLLCVFADSNLLVVGCFGMVVLSGVIGGCSVVSIAWHNRKYRDWFYIVLCMILMVISYILMRQIFKSVVTNYFSYNRAYIG